MDELLAAIKKQIAEMQKIDAAGFTKTETATAYLKEKEIILEGIVKTMETITAQETAEMEALKNTVKALRDDIKQQAANPKELTQKEFFYKLGKGIFAMSRGNNTIMGELGYTPNFGVKDWTKPNEYNWVMGKGWTAQKAALGDPMGDMTTSDKFLIHPTFETELVTIAEKKSVMMSLVDSVPMKAESVNIPVEEETDVEIAWQAPYGNEIPEVGQPKIENVEIKVMTCAGYVRFYDEFEEDSFIDLGKLFVKKFIGAYAREFDKQCLTANSTPFIGALRTNRAINHVIKGNSVADLTWEDFSDAVLQVPAEERKNCCWFLHETVVNHIMRLKNANGDYLVRRPMEKIPGVIDLYPYHECHVMPQFSEIEADMPLAVFVNPQRIQHRNRKGIELKRFDGTSDSLKFGTQALRFRKRDGFGLVIPKKHMVILRTKGSGSTISV